MVQHDGVRESRQAGSLSFPHQAPEALRTGLTIDDEVVSNPSSETIMT